MSGGSSLDLDPHFHSLLLDGVYDADGVFHRLPPPTTDEVGALVDVIAYRVERWLCRKGYGPEEPDEQDPDDALALVQAASLAGRTNLGRRKVRRVQTHGGREYQMPPRCAGCEGCNEPMSLRAIVWPPAAGAVVSALKRSARGPPKAASAAAP